MIIKVNLEIHFMDNLENNVVIYHFFKLNFKFFLL